MDATLPAFRHQKFVTHPAIQLTYAILLSKQFIKCFQLIKQKKMSAADIIVGITSGIFITDLCSGIFHIITDITSDDKDKEKSIAGNHHVDTLNYNDMKLSDMIFAGTATSIVNLAPLQLLNDTKIKSTKLDVIILTGYLLSTAVMWSHTQSHKRNHFDADDIHPFVAWLQDKHLLLHPSEHRPHHSNNHNSDFGLLNNWSAPLLNVFSRKFVKAMPLTKEEEWLRTKYCTDRKDKMKQTSSSSQKSPSSSFWKKMTSACC